jgi:DoxX-like family
MEITSGLGARRLFRRGKFDLLDPPSTAAEYQDWGYPNWFHFVTGGMELATAVLLIAAATSLIGAAIGCMVMIGAVGTLIAHGGYAHAILPLVILGLLVFVGWATFRTQTAASA